jgi:hypothetical protein
VTLTVVVGTSVTCALSNLAGPDAGTLFVREVFKEITATVVVVGCEISTTAPTGTLAVVPSAINTDGVSPTAVYQAFNPVDPAVLDGFIVGTDCGTGTGFGSCSQITAASGTITWNWAAVPIS